MRNLKKFLALVLAMVMAFSLMVTANAAKDVNARDIYPDAGNITEEFKEAVDVLYGMGVMTGDYGSFKPDQGIMRSEMAAVLYRLMTGDTSALKNNLYAEVAASRFIDVKESDWFAPYIGWCYDAGIMVGSNGYFRPIANVTGYETLVMVLRAMGYGKNHEYTGIGWNVNASSDGTLVGLLKDVQNTHYANTLAANTRRDVVASIVFQAAQLPTVTYTPSLGYNKYIGVASAQGGNILNPSLGEKYFGLTYHYGIVVGNQASGETGAYATKIGFSVNPTTSSNITGNNAAWATNRVLTDAEITNVIDDAAYYYLSDNDATNGTAENVTLSFDWKTDLSLFNHRVKVWYDARGNGAKVNVALGTNNGTGSVAFNTNCKTYALYDEAEAWVDTADWALGNGDGQLGKVFGAGTGTFFNYSFARMSAGNLLDGTTNTALNQLASEKSPIMANNDTDGWITNDDDYPLYLAIDNTGNGDADVIISLNLTISQVAQDNNTVVPLTTGVVSQNGTGTTYFDKWDQLNPSNGAADYSVIANKNITDSEGVSMNLNDYVAAVTVTGTTGNNDGTDDGDTTSITANTAGTAANMGNATLPNPNVTKLTMGQGAEPLVSTFFYKLANVNKTETKSLWKYDPATQECFFSDGSSLKQSVFALAVDGSFKAHQYVMAPQNSGDYTFYLDEAGDYLFWEQASAKSTFVYGTYIDWDTALASSTFDYPMVYTNDQGEEKLVKNITKINGVAMNITQYEEIQLPKRNNKSGVITGSDSGFVKGIYLGYSMNDKGELTTVTNTPNSTGFVQATNASTNFGSADITINANSLAIGAVAVGNDTSPNLFLTNDTKFIVVDGAGKANQSVKVYKGLAEMLGDGNTSVTLWTNTALQNSTPSGANYEGAYLDKTLLDGHVGSQPTDPAPAQANDNPYGLVYYSEKPFEYGQNYDPSARAVDTVFIPAQLITYTKSVNGDLYFVGNNAVNLINADDNATLYTMYKDGVANTYWITGMPNATAGDGVNDADIVNELGNNVFYQLVNTGRTAHDGGAIYSLLPIKWDAANKSLIGKFYGEDNANTVSTSIASATIRITNAAAGTANGYLATTYSSQVAYIGDLNKAETATDTNARGDEDLFNVGSANVKNLDRNYFSGTVDLVPNLTALNNTSSYTDNMGVDVSCVLNTSAYHTVSMIYVNYRS